MKLTTALAAILLAAPITIANPLPQDNVWTPPEMNLTTVSLEVEGSSIPFNTIYVSAHHGRLWLNVLDPDAECDSHTTSQIFTPLATFLTENTTNTLRLYHGPTPELSWQQVYVNHTTSGILYVDDVAASVPTDGWPTEVSGWTMMTPTVAGRCTCCIRGRSCGRAIPAIGGHLRRPSGSCFRGEPRGVCRSI